MLHTFAGRTCKAQKPHLAKRQQNKGSASFSEDSQNHSHVETLRKTWKIPSFTLWPQEFKSLWITTNDVKCLAGFYPSHAHSHAHTHAHTHMHTHTPHAFSYMAMIPLFPQVECP